MCSLPSTIPCQGLNEKALSLDVVLYQTYPPNMHTNLIFTDIPASIIAISKVNFRYFEMIDVNKTNQTNFRPKIANISPKS